MKELAESVDRVYQGLQHLQIASTKNNTAIVLDALQTLEQVYAYLTEQEEKHGQ